MTDPWKHRYDWNIPIYIFDLDGTLALTEHRQYLLQDKEDPECWKKFFAACVDDPPNEPVIKVLKAITSSVADLRIWSGRSDEVRGQTLAWLQRHIDYPRAGISPLLKMRPEGDYTPDEELKQRWLHEMTPDDRKRLVAVFDDRNKVVEMWRRNGVPCFQVAPADF